jgi:hypothetical protein
MLSKTPLLHTLSIPKLRLWPSYELPWWVVCNYELELSAVAVGSCRVFPRLSMGCSPGSLDSNCVLYLYMCSLPPEYSQMELYSFIHFNPSYILRYTYFAFDTTLSNLVDD